MLFQDAPSGCICCICWTTDKPPPPNDTQPSHSFPSAAADPGMDMAVQIHSIEAIDQSIAGSPNDIYGGFAAALGRQPSSSNSSSSSSRRNSTSDAFACDALTHCDVIARQDASSLGCTDEHRIEVGMCRCMCTHVHDVCIVCSCASMGCHKSVQ